jgi:ketosteroid isomerase-like protein
MALLERLHAALDARDVDALADCFAPDYRSDQPAHPGREFRGRDQVRANWTSVFRGVPDFTAELLSAARTPLGVEVAEWRWRGTYTDGSPFAMAGVTVIGVVGDRIAWGRLYMEPVEDGEPIDEMVEQTYRPPPA